MKKTTLLIIFFILAISKGFCQWQTQAGTYIKHDGLWPQKKFIPPADTTANKTGISLVNGKLYVGNGTKWGQVAPGGTEFIYKIDSNTVFVTPYQLLETIRTQAANFAPNTISFTANAGDTTFTSTNLVNQVITNVVRDGVSYDISNSTYDSSTVRYWSSTGKISFNTSFLAGVKVKVFYQPIAGNYNNYTTVTYVDTYADMLPFLTGATAKIFYVKADEENGGGTPAMYLYHNEFLIRLIPQQAN